MLLVGGGLLAGSVNTMAGGGSLLTVPLLVLTGLPGDVANGSNRVGILASNLSASATFRRLRGQLRFEGLDSLVDQLHRDVAETRAALA